MWSVVKEKFIQRQVDVDMQHGRWYFRQAQARARQAIRAAMAGLVKTATSTIYLIWIKPIWANGYSPEHSFDVK